MILSWNLASRGCVIIWISASYLEHIPMIPMKCRPSYLCYGQFPLVATFCERVAEVRDSPKFLKILRIEITSS
jgi:hypothetical protein